MDNAVLHLVGDKMEDNNKIASEKISKELPFIGTSSHDCNTFEEAAEKGAMKMAELKDKAIKQFFIEHIYPDISIETNEDEEPLAESFVSANMKRFELAEEMFNVYKRFEKRFLN